MKHVHFIGICGTAMAPIAKMMKDAGWRVTGSDKGIFPPMSDYLRENGIAFYVGFHPEKIGNPALAVVGNFAGLSNSEFISIIDRRIPYKSYPEILAEFLIKSESIVVAGTYGKTASTALLAWIWERAGLDPSFMSAGILKNFPTGTRNTHGRWSIVEGDEYPSSRWHPVPKFSFYLPKFLLLTGVQHDHLDVYPTEESFIRVFEELVSRIPHDGLIVAAADRPNVEEVLKNARVRVIRYGRGSSQLVGTGLASAPRRGVALQRPYRVTTLKAEVSPAPTLEWTLEILNRANGKTNILVHGPGETIGPVPLSLLGDESLDHIAGAVALARHAGIASEIIMRALQSFQGVRRRLEVRGVVKGITVIDDLGHSPKKAQAALHAVKCSFPDATIIAVYEPNVGSRVVSSKRLYHGAFHDANVVIIPRLSPTKVAEGEEARMEGDELVETIRLGRGRKFSTPTEDIYEPNDDALIERIKNTARQGDVVVFLGSHGFRGMIDRSIATL